MSIGDVTPRNTWKAFPKIALYNETDQKAHQAATSPHNDLPEPTAGQKESGDYAKGHVTIAGLPIAIENPQGSTRRGVDADGQEWSVTMRTHYGYLVGTLGADGDEVDVILMPGTEPDFAGDVYVIEQIDPSTGEFDEHKVVIGAFDEDQAIEAYHANYDDDWQGFGGIKSLDMAAFKEWLSQPPDGMMFDSLGQGIGAITEQDVQDDPLGVLDACLGVLEARQAAINNVRADWRTSQPLVRRYANQLVAAGVIKREDLKPVWSEINSLINAIERSLGLAITNMLAGTVGHDGLPDGQVMPTTMDEKANVLQKYGFITEVHGRWKYSTQNGKYPHLSADTEAKAVESAWPWFIKSKTSELRTKEQKYTDSVAEFQARMDKKYGGMSDADLQKEITRLTAIKDSLHAAGRREFNGNGDRRTSAAVANDGAREAGEILMHLRSYVASKPALASEGVGGFSGNDDQNIKYLSNKILADQNLVQQARVNNKDSLADYWLGTKSPIFDIILNDIDSLDADFVNRIFNDASFKKSFINKLIDYITPILPSADDVHLLQDAKPIKDSPSIQADGLLPFPWDEVNQGFYHSTRNSEATTNGFNQRYIDTVRGAMEKARPHIETVEQQVAFDQANSELQAQFISKIKRLAASRSGVYSGFMAGGSKLNTRQVERRGNSFDKTAIEIEKWMDNTAPDFIYDAVRSAMNNEQRQRERQQQQDAADTVVDQAAMDLWGLLTSTLPTKFAGSEVKAIGFSRDGLPSSLTIGGGWDPIKFTSLYKNKPYSVETLVNRLKAKGFDVPTKASQIKKSGSQTGTKKMTFNPDYKTITMDEWKRKSRDYKTIKDGQRYIFGMTESGASGLIPVNVVKSLAAFDSIGSELQGITDQDIQDDPLAVLDLCLGVLDVQSSAIMPTGRENTVKTAKGTKIGTKFMVIEADQLITSHDASGKENPLFPQELQPRDRSREASQTWVQKVAANLDPDSLGRTGRADSGAPIIGSDRVVESGNGRSMAIKLAYERGTAEEYRQFILDDAEYFGLDPDAIEAMNQPVLVRVRTTDIDRRVFTVEANQDDKLTFSATERARSDAKRLDDNLIGLFAPGEDGDLLTSGNQRFIQGFLKSLGDTESAQYMTTDGKPTKALVDRIKAAVFSKAYNDDRLLEMMADETKPEIQNVLNALGAAAPRFIEAQAYGRMATESVAEQVVDSIEQSLDQRVVDAVVNATNVLLASRAVGQDITEYVRQQGLFEDIDEGVAALAVFLAKNGRSAKRMGIAFKAMADFVKNDALDQTNNGLFGEPMPPSMVDVVAAANHRLVSIYGDEQNNNIGLFDSLKYDEVVQAEDAITRRIKTCLLKIEGFEKSENGIKYQNHRELLFGHYDDSKNSKILTCWEGEHDLVFEIGGYDQIEIDDLIKDVCDRLAVSASATQGLFDGMSSSFPTFVETATFSKKASIFLEYEQVNLLEFMLIENPERGDVISGGRGLRKIRLPRPGTGKSGGVRVIYYLANQHGKIVLLDLYPKSEKDNLSRSELESLVKAAQEYM